MNTGKKIYRWLTEIDANTGIPTGVRKPNLPTDPDYIAPITDLIACPLPSSTDPTVTIQWIDNSSPDNPYADRFCNTTSCGYEIKINRFDLENDIQTTLVEVSYDQGVNWFTLISNITQETFSDSLGGFSKKWYRVTVTDSQPASGVSNILKISSLEIGIGDLALVYNNVEYNAFNSSSPTNVVHSPQITFAIRNRSTTQIVSTRDLSLLGGSGVACVVKNSSNIVVQSIYLTRPQIGQFIAANNGWLPLVLQGIGVGNFTIEIAVDFPQDTGFPPFYQYIYRWWITIN